MRIPLPAWLFPYLVNVLIWLAFCGLLLLQWFESARASSLSLAQEIDRFISVESFFLLVGACAVVAIVFRLIGPLLRLRWEKANARHALNLVAVELGSLYVNFGSLLLASNLLSFDTSRVYLGGAIYLFGVVAHASASNLTMRSSGPAGRG